MLSIDFLFTTVAAFGQTAAPVPSATDVQEIETARVWAPITDYTRDGTPYVEFPPTVETRAAQCSRVADRVYDPDRVYECTYESRTKDMFASDFSAWEARRERFVWRKGCWNLADARP